MNSSDNGAIFRPAKVGRASEDVALQIEAAILSGQIRMGERLPSERKMQGVFRTSRGVIREALRALKEKGLIEIRKGSHGGASVKHLELVNISEPLALFLKQHQVPFESLIEFRESMDRTIAILACAKGTLEDKQALLDKTVHFEELIGHAEPDMEKIAEVDREMNIALVRMTGNPIFEMIMRTTQSGFSSQDQALYESPVYRGEAAANWRETAWQISVGEPLKALSSVSYHYSLLRRCLAQRQIDAGDAGDKRFVEDDSADGHSASGIWSFDDNMDPGGIEH